jgi:hypothetical protein
VPVAVSAIVALVEGFVVVAYIATSAVVVPIAVSILVVPAATVVTVVPVEIVVAVAHAAESNATVCIAPAGIVALVVGSFFLHLL